MRDAFVSAAALPDAAGARDGAELREIAQSSNLNQALLSQSRTIRQFFRGSAENLRDIATSTSSSDPRRNTVM